MSSAFANLSDVVPAVTTIPSEIDAIPVQVPNVAPYFTVFALVNVMVDFALVEDEVAAVRANLARVAAKIAAFRHRAVLIAAPPCLMCECGLRSSRRSARKDQGTECSNCFSLHVISQQQVY
jgi:hypothetical protein